KIKQSPAQSTPRAQPRNVRRDQGLINAVWTILETERHLRDVEAATRFLSEKQARLGDEAEQEELSRQPVATPRGRGAYRHGESCCCPQENM
ncbi:hypothetical protein M405DRAFT_832192, partial [Rhizopogon salebrosus TDB-379]